MTASLRPLVFVGARHDGRFLVDMPSLPHKQAWDTRKRFPVSQQPKSRQRDPSPVFVAGKYLSDKTEGADSRPPLLKPS
jgi:hypothetical protein